jgi:hypothetical protein
MRARCRLSVLPLGLVPEARRRTRAQAAKAKRSNVLLKCVTNAPTPYWSLGRWCLFLDSQSKPLSLTLERALASSTAKHKQQHRVRPPSDFVLSYTEHYASVQPGRRRRVSSCRYCRSRRSCSGASPWRRPGRPARPPCQPTGDCRPSESPGSLQKTAGYLIQ